MRNFFIIAFTLILSLELSAQTEEGTFLLGADSNFGFASVNMSYVDGVDDSEFLEMTSSQVDFCVSGGYFVIDGLALGFGVDHTSSKIELEGEDDLVSSLLTYGLLARYYIADSGVWGQGSLNFGTQDDGAENIDIRGIGITFGYAWYISNNISINPSLGYARLRSDLDDVEVKMGGIAGSVGIAIHL